MWPDHSGQKISQGIIDDWVNQYSNDSYYHWAIVLKDNGSKPIGDIAAVDMKEIFNGTYWLLYWKDLVE